MLFEVRSIVQVGGCQGKDVKVGLVMLIFLQVWFKYDEVDGRKEEDKEG